jgi:hypothetical protein
LVFSTTISVNGDNVSLWQDGQIVQLYSRANDSALFHFRIREIDQNKLLSARLKLLRANEIANQLDEQQKEVYSKSSFTEYYENNAISRSTSYYIEVNDGCPANISCIVGDIIHNIRSSLDIMLCDLIRLNGNQPNNRDQFKIKNPNHQNDFYNNVSLNQKSRRLVRLLLSSKSIRECLFEMHMLDVYDKHNSLNIVKSAVAKIDGSFGPQGFFIDNEGRICIGGSGSDMSPFMIECGRPESFRGVELVPKQKALIYKIPHGFSAKFLIYVGLSFSRHERIDVAGKNVDDTLTNYFRLVDRIIYMAQKYCH